MIVTLKKIDLDGPIPGRSVLTVCPGEMMGVILQLTVLLKVRMILVPLTFMKSESSLEKFPDIVGKCKHK